MSKIYNVTLPIAGHAYLTIEADSKAEAILKAMDEVTMDHIENWEALEQFNEGNVCHCPSPWRADAEAEEGDDEEDAE